MFIYFFSLLYKLQVFFLNRRRLAGFNTPCRFSKKRVKKCSFLSSLQKKEGGKTEAKRLPRG